MGRLLPVLLVLAALASPGSARAMQRHGGGMHAGLSAGRSAQSNFSGFPVRSRSFGSSMRSSMMSAGGWAAVYPVVIFPPYYAVPVVAGYGYGSLEPPPILAGPFVPMAMPWQGMGMVPPLGFDMAAMAGWAPANNVVPPANAAPNRAAERLEEHIKVGDRLFRAGQFNRASERYQRALQADPTSALPQLRLAQVSVKRGNYIEAAARLRDAHATDSDWFDHIPVLDVQNLFGDPAQFATEIGKLESHVQAHPEDREAWLVLGAELFLTGRTQRAAHVFVRLTDRKPDATLAGFLEACRVEQDLPR